MIKNLSVSAFADEYSPNFDTQLDMLSKNGVGYIEPRFIGEKNISDITCHEAKEIAKKLSYYGIGVSSIGSPLGKIKLSDDFSAHMERRRAFSKQRTRSELKTSECSAFLRAKVLPVQSFARKR